MRGAQIGRLALRVEGEHWKAYWAREDSMEDAVFLGSIIMGAIADKPERKEQFMALMRDVIGDVMEEATGTRPDWGGPQQAPEHERAGSA